MGEEREEGSLQAREWEEERCWRPEKVPGVTLTVEGDRLATLSSCPCLPASPLRPLMMPPVGSVCPEEQQPAGE